MTRITPIRHTVKGHKRQGKRVKTFMRGSGTPKRKPPKVVGVTPREVNKAPKVIRTRHHLTKLVSDAKRIHQTEMIYAPADQIEALVKDTLTKSHKAGYILREDYDRNIDTIHHWEYLSERVNDTKQEIRELEEAVVSMRDQIASVESGKWKVLRPQLPRYREVLERDMKSLSTKERRLKEALIEFTPLNNIIKSLKDNFKSYITHWRKK